MTYGLRPLLTQLDNGTLTSGNDCAVETILNVTRTVSRGKVGPQRDHYHDDWVRFVRAMAGEYRDGLQWVSETLRVYRHRDYERAFERVGLRPPRVQYGNGDGDPTVPWDYMRGMIRAGWVAHLPIDYGVLRRGDAPMGSRTFSGGHSICLVNPWEDRRGFLHARMGDSLMDGRKRWHNGRIITYPNGWQNVRVFDYKAAAGAWGSPNPPDGQTYAIFVKER